MPITIGQGFSIGPGFTWTDVVPTVNFLYAWGRNTEGQLGTNTTVVVSSPVQVGTTSTWAQIGCGYYAVSGLQSNGTLWTWGGNGGFGSLGLNTTTDYSSPVQVGALSNWAQVASSVYYYMAAKKTDGTLWTWGRNFAGQLGLGDTTNRSSPVQVGSASNWLTVACGYNHTGAITTNGTLYMWGGNAQGQLGLGDTNNRSSPTQVGALSIWTQVACGGQYYTAAIQSNGTLWSWGLNNNGQLGLNDTANRSSPAQVGTLTTWRQVSCGQIHTLAIQTDGTLWSWGVNNSGQLGLGDTVNRSSPVQIGALTNWAQVSCGYNHVIALQSNGTLWTWGRNDIGQLGLSNTINRSSPVQVGVLSNWSYVTATLSNDSFALLAT